MTQEKMNRISELTRIASERDLTPEETLERKALRDEYLAEWRRGVTNTLEHTCIDDGTGILRKLPRKKDTSI